MSVNPELIRSGDFAKKTKLPDIRSRFLGESEKQQLYTPREQGLLQKLHSEQQRQGKIDKKANANRRLNNVIFRQNELSTIRSQQAAANTRERLYKLQTNLTLKEVERQLTAINQADLYNKIELAKLSAEEQNPQQEAVKTEQERPMTEAELTAFMWKLQTEHQFNSVQKLIDATLEKLPSPMIRALSVAALFTLFFNACSPIVRGGTFDQNTLAQGNATAALVSKEAYAGNQVLGEVSNISRKVDPAIMPEKVGRKSATEVQALDNDGFLLTDINQYGINREYLSDLERSGKLINIAEKYPQLRLVNRERTQANEMCLPYLSTMISAYENETGSSDVTIISAYRGWSEQEMAWAQVEDKSKVTLPGFTEHHIGCTFDFGNNGRTFIGLNDGFYNWLKANGWKYGFVQSYTVERQTPNQIIAVEEWHWRWVGKEVAAIWQASQMSGNPEDLASILARINQVQRDGSSTTIRPQ